MNPTTRLQFYKDARTKVERSIASTQALETPLIMKCLALIKDDVGGSSQATRAAAIDTLVFLMGVKSAEIQTEVMKFTQENSGDEVLQRCVIKSLEKVVLNTIMTGQDFVEMLRVWLPYKEKIPPVIEDTCKSHIPPDKCKQLFLNTIIPSMMTEENLDADLRTVLIDAAFRLSCLVPINNLTTDEVNTFMKNIGTKYVVVITKLRDSEYRNWHKLWMFLVRFSGKYLHNSMDLTNKLLRVVEFAFRNVNYLQRLRGYDCWKELIDNASLDKAYISSNKQMKLLITPLKAKFSKQDVVICKRFVVFCYLIDKLQEKAVLCLREFLEFCFGPLTTPADSSKVGPVKSVSTLWLKSARALIDILGHYHNKEDCVVMEHVVHLQKPLVDSTNFPSFCGVILNSVFECCVLLKGVEDVAEREKVIKCLWGTIFYLAAVTDNNDCFEYISQILESIVEKSNDDAYFQKILMLIPSAFVTESKISIKLMEKLMKPMWKVLFNAENIPPAISDTFKHCITKIFANTTTVEEKIKIVKDVMKEILAVQITDRNVETVNKIWLCLAKEITDEFGVEKMEQFDNFNNFFLWPAYFIHNLEESDKKQTVLLWMKLYKKLTQDSDDRKIEIFKDLEKIFKNNPLLATNITSIVNIMSQFDAKHSNDFVCRLLDLVSQILELPNLRNDDEQKLVSLMLQYLDPNLDCYSDQSEHRDVVTKLCNCIKHTLSLHQSYKILEPLGAFLRNAPQNVRLQFSKRLNELLADLYKKQSDAKSYAAKELQKVMVIFEEGDEKEKKVFVVPSGRSARIANLAKKSPKSPQSLKLFGKDIDTLSPLKVKGSQLNNATPTRTKKAANVIQSKIRTPSSLDDESASKFVAIDSEVKFQPSKLSEHQKEVLKRRRDDIPALYQDLSQSQSQDFNSKSNSNDVPVEQQDVKERRSSRDVAEVIEELNEFVQVRTSFEEENKDDEEAKDTQKSEDLFGKYEAIVKARKAKEEQMEQIEQKAMLSESLFSQESTEETVSKISDVTSKKTEETGSKISDMTSLKVEETSSKTSGIPPLEVEETPSKTSGITPLEVEDTQRPVEGSDEAKTESKPKQETDEEKKKKKIAAELAKLQMNIVGADEYLASSRRRRAKIKDKDKEEEVSKKRRKSLSAQLEEKTASHPRRKTIESSSSENDTPKKARQKPEENVTTIVQKGIVSPKTASKQTPSADSQVIADSNENVSAPEKELERDCVSEIPTDISPKEVLKNMKNEASVDVRKQETVPAIADKKTAKSLQKRTKRRDSETSDVPEQTPPELSEQKVGKSPRKGPKAKTMESTKIPSEPEQTSSKSPRRASRRQHSEISNTPEQVRQKVVPASTESEQKHDESQRKVTHKRDLSRQLVNVGKQDEPTADIVRKDLKSPKKKLDDKLEQSIVPISIDSGQDAVDSPRKRVRRIVNEHSYVVKNVEVEQIVSICSDTVSEATKTQQSSPKVDAEEIVSTLPEFEHKVSVKLQEDPEHTASGTPLESEEIVEEQPTEHHITAEEDCQQAISDTTESACVAKIKRKKKHGEAADVEDDQVIGFDHGEVKISKRKHKKKHSDHDSSEDGGEFLVGTKSPKKKSKKKHAVTPEKIEAGKAAERRFKKRLSDLESEIDHCRQFISQSEHDTDDLEIVNNEIVSPSASTIKIRLKRRDPEKRRSKKDKYEVARTQEEESRKRKLSTDEECEDVIESSQESYANVTSLTNASKRLKLMTSLDVTEEETMVQSKQVDCQSHSTLTQDKVADLQEIETDLNDQDTTECTTVTEDTTQESLNVEEQPETVKTDTQETLSQLTQRTQDTIPDIITGKIADAKAEGFYFELPQKPDLTDSEQMMCKMDTMSVCLHTNPDRSSLEEIEIRAATPEKAIRAEEVQSTPSTNSITSSPVTGDTPNRNSELLNDTIDISPISQGSTTSTCDSVEISVAKALVFEPKEGHVTETGNEENRPQCWSFAAPEALFGQDSPPEEAKDPETSEETKETSTIQERSSKFLSVAHLKSPLSHRRFAKRKGGNAAKMSPSTGRIMRLMSNFNHKPHAEDKGEENVREEDLLTFSREVPSPLAVPRSGILKRKLSDSTDSDGLSPATKRKRVNFSDPCLTSKKIFIKDEDFQPSAEAKRLCDAEQQVKSATLGRLFWHAESADDDDDAAGGGGEAESEQVETEQSLDIVSAALMRKDRPIYPKLMGCEDDVIVILKRVTSPMFVSTLMNKLKDRGIRTIGDLAGLSEVEVGRFPFKVPVVANVYKALDNYYYKKMANRHKEEESSKVDDTNKYSEECRSTSAISPPRSVRINGFPAEKLEEESSPITGKEAAVAENAKEPIETAIVNLKQIISQSPMLEKTSKCIIRCLMETIGVSKLIDSVSAMCDGEEDRANLTACLSRMTTDRCPSRLTSDGSLSRMTSDSTSVYATAPRVRNLAEIKTIVEGSVGVGEVSREEVIEQCLLPLVQSPRDLYGYIRRVKVVELGDVVIERLKGEEVDGFLQRIMSTYPKESLQCAVKNCRSILVAPSELVNTFQSFLDDRSEDVRKEVMVEMFRYISGKLDAATLLSLHVEFLRGMQQVVQSSTSSL